METSKSDFGWRIKEICFYHRMTQAEMADTLNVSRQGIGNWVVGKTYPSIKYLLKILEHYPSVNYVWLYTGEGDKGFS